MLKFEHPRGCEAMPLEPIPSGLLNYVVGILTHCPSGLVIYDRAEKPSGLLGYAGENNYTVPFVVPSHRGLNMQSYSWHLKR